MKGERAVPGFLADFKRFIEFLQGLWGILAGVSTLFPLPNTLLQVIPLASWPEGGLAYFSSGVISAVATLVCLFVVLWTFGQRQRFGGSTRGQATRRAWRAFLLGIVALVVYLLMHYAIRADFYFGVFGWESGDLRRILGDVLLLVTYSAWFAMVTRAFVLLGLVEFLGLQE